MGAHDWWGEWVLMTSRCCILQAGIIILTIILYITGWDLLPLLVTFFVCIFKDIEYGILSGVGVSALMLLFPMARPGLKVN